MANTVLPVLTVFRKGRDYILRLSDTKDNFLAVEIAKLIPDADSLLLVTPADTKLFDLTNQDKPEFKPATSKPRIIETAADPMQEALDLAEEDEPEPTNIRRRETEPLKPNSVCGRCQGQGQVAILLEGGQAGQGACPVCQGTGSIVRYGKR